VEVHTPLVVGEEKTKTKRACYSFCMCPGGQIVPTSTDVNELCINGGALHGVP